MQTKHATKKKNSARGSSGISLCVGTAPVLAFRIQAGKKCDVMGWRGSGKCHEIMPTHSPYKRWGTWQTIATGNGCIMARTLVVTDVSEVVSHKSSHESTSGKDRCEWIPVCYKTGFISWMIKTLSMMNMSGMYIVFCLLPDKPLKEATRHTTKDLRYDIYLYLVPLGNRSWPFRVLSIGYALLLFPQKNLSNHAEASEWNRNLPNHPLLTFVIQIMMHWMAMSSQRRFQWSPVLKRVTSYPWLTGWNGIEDLMELLLYTVICSVTFLCSLSLFSLAHYFFYILWTFHTIWHFINFFL